MASCDKRASFTLTIIKNAALNLRIRYEINGVAIPLEGRTVRWQIRSKENSASPLLLDLTPYLIHEPIDDENNPQLGVVELSVPAAITNTLRTGGFHDAFCGEEFWFEGEVHLNPNVTT